MNKRQKLVQKQFLNNEEEIIKRLNRVYSESLTDINNKIKNLTFTIDKLQREYDWLDPDDPERARIKSMIQSKIYQKQYQEQLKDQIDPVLKTMQIAQFDNISEYLDHCYNDGFIGTFFDAHGQGVPVIAPINQESMVRAVQLESKISKGLYTRLGADVDLLKKKITAQVSRSIATGMTFSQTAQALENYSRIGYNNAIRIIRTEGHRIQTTATMDAMTVAKDKGADVVKQWDSTLDGRTRHSHAIVDGEIRELNKPFSNGLDFPGDPDGNAAEVVNCRCALLQRARWALDDDELQTLQDRAIFFGLDKANEFDDFKKKYLKAVTTPATTNIDLPSLRSELKTLKNDIAQLRQDLNRTRNQLYYGGDKDALNAKIADIQQKIDDLQDQVAVKGKMLVENMNTTFKVSTDNKKFVSMVVDLDTKTEYKEVMQLPSVRTIDEIVGALGGGDNTSGSCASVGLGYIGQKNGWDVLDFRGGDSMKWFSSKSNKINMWDSLGVKYITEDSGKSNLTNGKRILAKMEKGKEYYLSVGRHASIVRKNNDGVIQYLELQSANRSGWTDFNKDIGETLRWRFGCTTSSNYPPTAYMTDVADLENNDEFRTILGYINTSKSAQRKGSSGTIK